MPPVMSETLERSRTADVLVLSVNRPERRNALDPETIEKLASAIRQAAGEGSRAIVLTAVGDTAFGSGMDLHALRTDRARAGVAVNALREAMESATRPPIIAAVNGDAMGGGFELTLRCELVVAASHARFGLPEVTHGLMPGSGATLLPCRIPIATAMMLVLAAEPITATEARELGLVNRVVDRHDLHAVTLELATRVASHAPVAVAGARRALWASLDGRARGWEVTTEEIRNVSNSADMHEGLAAFAERRRPRWTGA
jgi:enoyl-CoA hydratase